MQEVLSLFQSHYAMLSKEVSICTTHPYFISEEITDNTKTVWFLVHGYAQLAKKFMDDFKALKAKDTVLIAPQALSLFYLKGFKGKTGATWMTTEHRETDIQNYLTYLDSIYHNEVKPNSSGIQLRVLGFSQGAATASRWLANTDIPFDQLVLWGGFLAHEIGKNTAQKHFSGDKLILIYGDNDPFFSPNIEKNTRRKLKVFGLNPKIITFKGAHEIHEPTLIKLR